MAEGFRPELDAYDGPLDIMLDLARRHKIDLTEVSIGTLVDQFLIWLEQVLDQSRGLERGASALIAVAWLVDLKIRSLIPGPSIPQIDGPDALRRQLLHLDLIRNLGARLMERPRLGRDVFERGFSDEPRIFRRYKRAAFGRTLYHHISAPMEAGQVNWVSKTGYALQVPAPAAELKALVETARMFGPRKLAEKSRPTGDILVFRPPETISVDLALKSFRAMMAQCPDGFDFDDAVPKCAGALRRSAVASSLVAILEMAREGEVQIEQDAHFAAVRIMQAQAVA
jgi:segregation and condensation protein A